MSFFTGKKLLFLGFLAVLLAAVPLTVYFLQQQTKTQTSATPATTIAFSPVSSQTSPITKAVGEQFSLDIVMNPGTNQVIASTLYLTFDATKLQIVDPPGLEMTPVGSSGQGFTSILAGPTYTPTGTASITMTIGNDITKAIKAQTKIASITFKGLAQTTSPIQVAFDRTKMNVTSTSDPEIDVLSSSPAPAFISIGQSASASATPIPTPTVGVQNQLPVCTGLNVDRTTSGPAPFSITFTANGNDPDGTISKVTFDFGDGPLQDATQAGGIGTKTVSVQAAHTYNNAGTFTSKATLTDNSGGVSTALQACSQTITVTAAVGVGTTTPTPTLIVIAPTATPTPIAPTSTIPPGPADTIIGVGVFGVILTVIGAFLLLTP